MSGGGGRRPFGDLFFLGVGEDAKPLNNPEEAGFFFCFFNVLFI
jgi:hypothetical protein